MVCCLFVLHEHKATDIAFGLNACPLELKWIWVSFESLETTLATWMGSLPRLYNNSLSTYRIRTVRGDKWVCGPLDSFYNWDTYFLDLNLKEIALHSAVTISAITRVCHQAVCMLRIRTLPYMTLHLPHLSLLAAQLGKEGLNRLYLLSCAAGYRVHFVKWMYDVRTEV